MSLVFGILLIQVSAHGRNGRERYFNCLVEMWNLKKCRSMISGQSRRARGSPLWKVRVCRKHYRTGEMHWRDILLKRGIWRPGPH